MNTYSLVPDKATVKKTRRSARFFGRIAIMVLISFFVGGISGGGFGYYLVDKRLDAEVRRLVENKTIQVEEESETVQAVLKVSPAVVSIVIKKDYKDIYNNSASNWPFDNNFFFFPGQPIQPQQQDIPEGQKVIGSGSGFIVSADGLVLTNKHVVSDEKATYEIVMSDKSTLPATVVDRDPVNDLAILKIDGKDLPFLQFGDSDQLKIGQTVIAVGNALGEFANSVTKGVVSGVGRRVVAGDGGGKSEVLAGVIQTDAAINFGNSGGPLINLSGEVIGINTAVSQEGQLIGFAIPSNDVKVVVESVVKTGKISRPFLGIMYVLLNEDIAKRNNLKLNAGAWVNSGNDKQSAVVNDSAADKAGIKDDDIIIEFQGEKITEDFDLSHEISSYHPGDTVKLKIWRETEEKEISAVLGEYEKQ